ncbi:aldehyde dehydrogenase family protein [Microbacterium sp. SSW1-49]|uniref:Aldehyde dehydrogenase family protein n=2 Tax=Microbacterium croceum TaxID=2851645 RepID=A0ABT0FB60_9MICO|nr:aldehyde dehydrogenase family protein [Microbacterium croceum]
MPTTDTLVIRNPADGAELARIPVTAASEVAWHTADALEVHRSGVWSSAPPRARAAALLRLADLMQRDAETLARLDSEDAGKPITECRENDVPGAIESIRWFAEALDKQYGRVSTTSSDVLAFTEREPFGVVAAILPWNYPLAMACWKLGPALAVGNALILKPADATPRSTLHLAALAEEAGIPPGVLRVLPGTGAETGAALAADPIVEAISFTGSTTTGRKILTAAAATNLKRVSLELGGKSPQVLMADALAFGDHLIDGLIEAAFLTAGQNCTAGSRILVHESIHDEIVDRLSRAAAELTVGDPSDAATQIGPVIDAVAADRILGAIDTAVADGARIATGGVEVPVVQGGRYIAPTVLTELPANAEVLRTEIFGPVVTVQRFGTRDEAIALANAVDYGLAASVWTKDIDDALAVARGIRAGLVSVGTYSEGDMTVPFGGWRQSGFGGAEKSLQAFAQWSREKAIWVQSA